MAMALDGQDAGSAQHLVIGDRLSRCEVKVVPNESDLLKEERDNKNETKR